MTEQIPDDDATAGRNPQEPPRRAPRGLEELARSGLKTKADDSRLGDLSEQYVRTLDRARAILGESSLAMALSRLAAHIRYLFSTANVMLFAQPADPVQQMAAAKLRPECWQPVSPAERQAWQGTRPGCAPSLRTFAAVASTHFE